jgi:hypothetical protein
MEKVRILTVEDCKKEAEKAIESILFYNNKLRAFLDAIENELTLDNRNKIDCIYAMYSAIRFHEVFSEFGIKLEEELTTKVDGMLNTLFNEMKRENKH